MTEQEALNHKVDRSGWKSGPWESEPDRVDFEHAGLACLGLRNGSMGFWCGYVGVGPDHPAAKDGFEDSVLDVHGGITFTGKCSPPICHVPKPGMPAEVKWFGFDCGHYLDSWPGRNWQFDGNESYRDLHYVTEQIKALADQLAVLG